MTSTAAHEAAFVVRDSLIPELTICLDCGAMTAPPANGPSVCARCAATRAKHAPVVKRSGERVSDEAKARRRIAQRFYSSPEWRRVRDAVRRRDGACLECGTRRDLTVDHIIPRTQAPELAYDPENLRTLCRRCHGRVDGIRGAIETARVKRERARSEVDAFLREGNSAREAREPSRTLYGDGERAPVVA